MADELTDPATPATPAASPASFFGKVFRLLNGSESEASADEAPAPDVAPAPPIEPPVSDPALTETVDLPLPPVIADVRLCPACASPLSDAGSCSECGYFASESPAQAAPLTPLVGGNCVGNRLEICELCGQRGTVNLYVAKWLADGRTVLVKEALAAKPPASPTEVEAQAVDDVLANLDPAAEPVASSESQATADNRPEPVVLCDVLQREREILLPLKYPSIPKVIDALLENGRCYLVLERLAGRSLREAWNQSETSEGQRLDWLIQLCQALAKVHAQQTLFNAITPDGLYVDERGRLVLPDFSSARKLPLTDGTSAATRFAAPELLLEPGLADARADLYSFGATWYSLMLGRELADADFEAEFAPLPCTNQLPEAHPLVARLLLKTFARNPEQRFPTEEERARGTLPIAELQRHLLVYKRCLQRLCLSLGAQTSVGVVRTANEDNFVAWKTSGKTGDESQEAALLVLADGMGGAAAGEVASEIAVRTVREKLGPCFWDWGSKSPDEQARLIPSALQDAVCAANQAVVEYCVEHPEAQGLACTLDVVAIVGSQAVVAHVGDSRVAKVTREGLTWITEDQTLVARLQKLGIINEEEAQTHPDRSKLLQAIGGGKQVEPAIYHLALERGDYLLCCSDGLTGHVDDARIGELVLGSSSPQAACNRLINEANTNGGTDNTTVIVAAIN